MHPYINVERISKSFRGKELIVGERICRLIFICSESNTQCMMKANYESDAHILLSVWREACEVVLQTVIGEQGKFPASQGVNYFLLYEYVI